MEREIVKIDRELCNGCGECIPNCHEGALQMIDDKATLVSDLLCDGLGACIGHCPVGAITIEKREAQPYSEVAALQEMIPNGKNTVIAHLNHLLDHKEEGYLKEGFEYLLENNDTLEFDAQEVIDTVLNKNVDLTNIKPVMHNHGHNHGGGGCPGSQSQSFAAAGAAPAAAGPQPSTLEQWPVQMHLINPNAPYFKKSDFLLAADCVAFSLGDFHQTWLKGKTIGIACPKLDSNMDIYIEKLVHLINNSELNTITVMKMQVPCCGGILQMAKVAMERADRKVPIKQVTVGIQGDIIEEEWV